MSAVRRRRGISKSEDVPGIFTDGSSSYLEEEIMGHNRTGEFQSALRALQSNTQQNQLNNNINLQSKKVNLEHYVQFMQIARTIGQNINETYNSLEKLGLAAKQKSLFDYKSPEIQELTFIIKEDIGFLNQAIVKAEGIGHDIQRFNGENVQSHASGVIEVLRIKLTTMSNEFNHVLQIQLKRTVDYQTMSRITSHSSRSKSFHDNKQSTKSAVAATTTTTIGPNNNNNNNKKSYPSTSQLLDNVDSSEHDSSAVPAYFDDDLSPEEMQILEEENAHLLNELNTLADEVDQIQSSVVQIAQLQELITDKVISQAKDIDKVADTVVGATENIRGGNEQIRQAIQKNADFRAWILFFIIVMSFSLLFLDWYND